MQKQKAVVDSSFWININKANSVKYLFDYFELYFTEKVEDELSDYKSKKPDIPKDLDVFIQLKKLNFINIKTPKTISKKLQNCLSNYSGEIYTIALAEELKAMVLVDDYGSTIFCKNNHIPSITTISFIYRLYDLKIITKDEAKQKINLIKKSLNKDLINSVLKKIK